MSDSEVIIKLLRSVEWRVRVNRLLHELSLAVSAVLLFLIVLKIADLFSPFRAITIALFVTAAVIVFVAYMVQHWTRKGTLQDAAVSLDRKAGLHDEVKTAFWFINNPRSSEWVQLQIQRAAGKARNIDIDRTFPGAVPRNSYAAIVMIVIFAGLNFVPLPLNHNWFKLQAAPAGVLDNGLLANASAQPLDEAAIKKGLLEIAKQMRQAELLKEVADALEEGDLKRAAEELRKAAQQLAKASKEDSENLKKGLENASGTKTPELADITQDIANAAEAVEENDEAEAEEELDQAAANLEQLGQKMEGQAPGFEEQRGNQDSPSEDGQRMADDGKTPKRRSNTNGPGASNPAPGVLTEFKPSTLENKLELDVKLQVEALEGQKDKSPTDSSEESDERAEASKQERSKVDYRNVKSELTPAQKDLLNQDHIPWEYRPLIKSYFQAIRPAVKN